MGRYFMIGAQLTATILFMINFDQAVQQNWISLLVPMVLIVLVVINSLRFTRLVSWTIFAISFFSFMVVLSAFTMSWRLVPGFKPMPFYRTMLMYVAFVYVSLAQIKILGGGSAAVDQGVTS